VATTLEHTYRAPPFGGNKGPHLQAGPEDGKETTVAVAGLTIGENGNRAFFAVRVTDVSGVIPVFMDFSKAPNITIATGSSIVLYPATFIQHTEAAAADPKERERAEYNGGAWFCMGLNSEWPVHLGEILFDVTTGTPAIAIRELVWTS